MTRDDFDIITENGKHLGPSAEFNSAQFQNMMRGELWRFSRRELNNVISVSGDEQSRSMLLMLKIMETSTRSSFSEVTRLLTSIHALLSGTGGSRHTDDNGPVRRTSSAGVVGPPERTPSGNVIHVCTEAPSQPPILGNNQNHLMESLSSDMAQQRQVGRSPINICTCRNASVHVCAS
jgi:hypothetical protein